MKRISKIDAYQGMDDIDFKVMDQELAQHYSFANNKEDISHEFFLDDDGSCIVMKVYFVGEEVAVYRFQNKGVLTGEGKKAVGRPALGTTKKVSITLEDETWKKIYETMEENDLTKSALFREIIEKYFSVEQKYTGESDYEEFKDFVFSTNPSEMIFHVYKHGLFIATAVTEIEPYYDEAGVKISFQGGNFHVWATNNVQKCFRPANLIIECEICFQLYNEYNEFIGYIYKKK
ncbi:ribbon-helix-helix domain-containing protein [Paenibacillus apiarius]|uniref:Uncharacterized protein n=1 Tax=Paenibacillus apiarius TaxID=46240 RepID=A0ABT4DWE2_9BACL|nr:hypothetical protein [Paenibacillus apiarius]MCY9517762.1 hypothetical protein [Paenibacillus apiarius]MCY9520593.1 hypothetical protein [Paenibacillus apiarius]MCY9555444.1 hypothetical protein [Paenibacillus apiarius]MCY9561113.1 hypothetical protein [Paenibacillus apiarius]MCY9687089.1 hypothetical protein [Paenibacillus apiarius]